MVTKVKTCSTCGADQELLKEMLEELPYEGKLESENRAIARIIIGNCKECQEVLNVHN